MNIVKPRQPTAAFSFLLLYLVIATVTRAQVDSKRAVLVEGTGTYSMKISTQNELAQNFFDQGLRLAYGYYMPEAIASFQEAARLDKHPMIYWGMALAMGPVPNSRYSNAPDDPYGEGKKAITRALELADQGTEREQALIQTLAVRYDTESYPDRANRDSAYLKATKELLDRYPDDPDIGTLYADAYMVISPWKYWDSKGNPRPGTKEAAQTLEYAMDNYPYHPGANHLYIHLLEASMDPERAYTQAERLADLMPKAGHITHMPSHIYLRMGEFDKVIATNERSIKADRDFLKIWGDHPYPALGSINYSSTHKSRHAYDFIRFAAIGQGNYERAIQAARNTVKVTPSEIIYDSWGQRYFSSVILVQKIFGKWNEILQEKEPKGSLYVKGIWRYALGSAYAGLDKLSQAEAELKKLRKLAGNPDAKEIYMWHNTAANILKMAAYGLEGEIREARGDYAGAVSAFQSAVEIQDQMAYMEPPDWPQSFRLYLGQALLKAGKYREAEKVYRKDLVWNLNNGWTLHGLWQSLLKQGENAEASEVHSQFKKAWKDADVTLTGSRF